MCIFCADWAKGSFWCKRHMVLPQCILAKFTVCETGMKPKRRLCPTQRRHSPTQKAAFADRKHHFQKEKVLFGATDITHCFFSKRREECQERFSFGCPRSCTKRRHKKSCGLHKKLFLPGELRKLECPKCCLTIRHGCVLVLR